MEPNPGCFLLVLIRGQLGADVPPGPGFDDVPSLSSDYPFPDLTAITWSFG
jgi:hypothetical protein